MKTFSVENKQSNSRGFLRSEILSARINTSMWTTAYKGLCMCPDPAKGQGLASRGPRPLETIPGRKAGRRPELWPGKIGLFC